MTTTFAQIKATAARAGYTRRVIVEYGAADFYGWIKPTADLERPFTMIEDKAGTVVAFPADYTVNVRDLDD